MIPEAIVAMLACARIGAIHTVVFGGFSPAALSERLLDSGAKVLITADAGRRAGKVIPLKANADAALALMRGALASGADSKSREDVGIQKVVVVQHTGESVAWNPQQDMQWTDLGANCPDQDASPAWVSSQHPLFILYTSGSTGAPKGLVHGTGGYLLYAASTFESVFDYRPGDVYWCAADIGWITGHSYLVYGPMALGATSVLFEGAPSYPDASRIWQVIDRYQVTQLYTAPTLIRSLMSQGDAFLQGSSRGSLRVLGSVGEPINPEAWHWYHDRVGQGRCAVVDTWWQTETGGHLITPLPADRPHKAGCATQPFWGVRPVLLNPQGQVLEQPGATGALCISKSWPGQAITLWKDHPRFVATYFTPYPGYYYSGDGAMRDAQGDYWLQGRMGTAEVEAAIAQHPEVAEAAVVGVPHAIKGQALCAYVVPRPGTLPQGGLPSDAQLLSRAIQQGVKQCIGGLAVPEFMYYVPELPKTRSGKVMRRLLRQIASGQVTSLKDKDQLGDTSTLVDPACIELLICLTHSQHADAGAVAPRLSAHC
jgi:acetyl-CoA synthetase